MTATAAPTLRGRRRLQARSAARVAIALTAGIVLTTQYHPAVRYLRASARAVGHADLRWMVAAVAAELASMAVFARLQRRMLRVGGVRIPAHVMLELSYAANALSVTLPAGTALSSSYLLRRLRSVGASTPVIGFALLSSGVLSVVSFAALGLAAGALSGSGAVSILALSGEAAAAIVLAWYAHRLVARPARLSGSAENVLHVANTVLRRPRERGAETLHAFLDELARIRVRRRDWCFGLLLAGGNWLTDLACLLAACRATGTPVPVPLVLTAFLAGAGAAGLSLVPGGVGTVEAAMVLVLTHGGMGIAAATSAVLLYRLISFVLVVSLGWLAWALDRRSERRDLHRHGSQRVHRRPSRRTGGDRLRPSLSRGKA